MKTRIYKGFIFSDENDKNYLQGIDLNKSHLFYINGFWTSSNGKTSSYKLCDTNGEDLPEFEHLQFSRNKNNVFFLESVD